MAFISVFFGKLPRYFDYFIASANHLRMADFYIYTDQVSAIQRFENVRIAPLSFGDLNGRLERIFSAQCDLKSAWKVCDIKPLYGLLFPEVISDYKLWGMCDLDILWGNIDKKIQMVLDRDLDFYSSTLNWASGHCCIYKNCPNVNSIPLANPRMQEVVNSEEYFAFEESGHRWYLEPTRINQLINNDQMPSMFDIAHEMQYEGKLKCFFDASALEFINYKNPFCATWKPGLVYEEFSDREYAYFHMVVLKKIWKFFIPSLIGAPSELRINRSGIRDCGASYFAWVLRKLAYSMERLVTRFWRKVLYNT